MISSQRNLVQNEAEARLEALPGSSNNTFSSNVWCFENRDKKRVKIDFSFMEKLSRLNPKWSVDSHQELTQQCKYIWLALAENSTQTGYKSKINGLELFFSALANQNKSQLNRDNFDETISFVLTRKRNNNEYIQTHNIKSYSAFTNELPLLRIKGICFELGYELFSPKITESYIKKQLSKIIPFLSDDTLTYRDWKNGGSYNCLTLDHGRYYIEHCLNFFETYYPLAVALQTTRNNLDEIARECGYSKTTVENILPTLLQGYSPEELMDFRNAGYLTNQRIFSATTKHFKKIFKILNFKSKIIHEHYLERLALGCNLEPSLEVLDRLRVITCEWFSKKDQLSTQALLNGFKPKISFRVFSDNLNGLRKEIDLSTCSIPSPEDYTKMGITPSQSEKRQLPNYPAELIYLVQNAGLICILALTGWRRSEFGFPSSAVEVSDNLDKLDQFAFPRRYHVNWVVPKSHGEVEENREISFSIFLLIEKMSVLTMGSPKGPCLYPVSNLEKDNFNSAQKVTKAVPTLWSHYVQFYAGFKLLDDKKTWNLIADRESFGRKLSKQQKQQKKLLLDQRSQEEWDSLTPDLNLIEAWQRTRKEWPKLNFFFNASKSNKGENWVFRYKLRQLDLDWLELLDESLSTESKEWILQLEDKECNSQTVAKVLRNEILTDVLYPTPHSFRHMWAEAIYRRFDGDAGWLIRSQFKHIAKTQWLRYIRNKDNRFMNEHVKVTVINSLVRNFLYHKGEGYSGQIKKWLLKLFNQTYVLMPEEQESLVNYLTTTEIENIRVHPWGYCLMKKGSRHRAKCAEFNEPQPFNASPLFCLDCPHCLLQSNNVEWLLLQVSSHVATLSNPKVPNIFKASSLEYVKLVVKHVRNLDPKHTALPELTQVIEKFNAEENI